MLEGAIQGLYTSVFFGVVFLALFVFPLTMFGPALESRYFPVLEQARLIDITQFTANLDRTSKYLTVYEKTRNCRPLPGIFAWYLVDSNEKRYRVPLIFTAGQHEGYDDINPVGFNIAGIWKVHNINDVKFVKQIVVLQYDCHWLWNTSITIEFDHAT